MWKTVAVYGAVLLMTGCIGSPTGGLPNCDRQDPESAQECLAETAQSLGYGPNLTTAFRQSYEVCSEREHARLVDEYGGVNKPTSIARAFARAFFEAGAARDASFEACLLGLSERRDGTE